MSAPLHGDEATHFLAARGWHAQCSIAPALHSSTTSWTSAGPGPRCPSAPAMFPGPPGVALHGAPVQHQSHRQGPPTWCSTSGVSPYPVQQQQQQLPQAPAPVAPASAAAPLPGTPVQHQPRCSTSPTSSQTPGTVSWNPGAAPAGVPLPRPPVQHQPRTPDTTLMAAPAPAPLPGTPVQHQHEHRFPDPRCSTSMSTASQTPGAAPARAPLPRPPVQHQHERRFSDPRCSTSMSTASQTPGAAPA